MRTHLFPRMQRWLAPAAGVTGLFLALFLALQAVPAYAQPPDCNGVITQLDGALAPGICDVLGVGSACLATRTVNATPRTGTIRFTAPGDNAQLNNIRRMITVPKQGAAVLLGGSSANPVKILVFGDTATAPSAAQSGSVFTLRASNGQPTCERTRSGMILQTPGGKNGTIVVNGVNIKLGSTAYVVPGADLLFDQDPRTDRRQGSRNPSAPLCSGFDSDCDFGDDSCRRTDRLVYGPFCREDSYPYIAKGLYRVTLYGEGEVQAGATDYNISHDYQMMGTHRLTLPGSYTFCWDGPAARRHRLRNRRPGAQQRRHCRPHHARVSWPRLQPARCQQPEGRHGQGRNGRHVGLQHRRWRGCDDARRRAGKPRFRPAHPCLLSRRPANGHGRRPDRRALCHRVRPGAVGLGRHRRRPARG